MKNSPHHREHERHKAIQSANSLQESSNPQELIMNKEYKKQFNAKETTLPHHRSEAKKKTSKRTAPGEVDYETERTHVHGENEKWNATIRKQNKEKNLLFNNKKNKNKT